MHIARRSAFLLNALVVGSNFVGVFNLISLFIGRAVRSFSCNQISRGLNLWPIREQLARALEPGSNTQRTANKRNRVFERVRIPSANAERVLKPFTSFCRAVAG